MSSMAIPTRGKRKMKGKAVEHMSASSPSQYGSSADSHYGSSYGSSAVSPKSSAVASSPAHSPVLARRRSLMSSTFTKTEHTTVQVGDPENPRLIACVKSSQGFDWNQEMFLPPYVNHQFGDDLERKQDPVEDIIVTDEEIANLLPS